MSLLGWIGLALGAVVVLLFVQLVQLSLVLARTQRETRGLGYYGRAPDERAAFKRDLARHARRLRPIIRLLARTSRFRFDRASFEQEGIRGPLGTCDAESFARGMAYEPRAEDVFVVTQMKCGTTWMQHLIYQILCRGRGDLVESGRALYAISPWLEAHTSVSVEEAPLLGTGRPSRIVKTHLPASHCPASPESRYIYVARHPVSCFASCLDFIAENAGSMAPEPEAVEAWFCSEAMWWTPWPSHVSGWWERSREAPNVLFVHFEEMVDDLAGVARRVAEFLELPPLSGDELAAALEKCSFAYMKRHAEAFEMHPPHLFSTGTEFFRRGSSDRHRDVPPEMAARIGSWCARAADAGPYPLGRFYPDVLRGLHFDGGSETI